MRNPRAHGALVRRVATTAGDRADDEQLQQRVRGPAGRGGHAERPDPPRGGVQRPRLSPVHHTPARRRRDVPGSRGGERGGDGDHADRERAQPAIAAAVVTEVDRHRGRPAGRRRGRRGRRAGAGRRRAERRRDGRRRGGRAGCRGSAARRGAGRPGRSTPGWWQRSSSRRRRPCRRRRAQRRLRLPLARVAPARTGVVVGTGIGRRGRRGRGRVGCRHGRGCRRRRRSSRRRAVAGLRGAAPHDGGRRLAGQRVQAARCPVAESRSTPCRARTTIPPPCPVAVSGCRARRRRSTTCRRAVPTSTPSRRWREACCRTSRSPGQGVRRCGRRRRRSAACLPS